MAGAYDGSIRINTKIDQAGAKTGLATLTKSLKNFALTVGVAFGVGAVVSFSQECINLASDLNEVQNVIETTFGGSVGLIENFADIAAVQFGLSELAAKQYTGTMGAMLKSMGFAESAAADMSIEMASLAGDMASFYNLSTDEAFEKIRSGISGETEPLKQLGVNLSEANLSAYAMAQGMTTAYGSLSEQNKALLRYNYLLDVTKDAQGDFAKTSSSWANQVRILQMQWDSMKATLGGAFIQVLTPVLQMLNLIIGRLNAAAETFAAFIAAVTGNSQKVTTASAEATGAVEGLTNATDASGEAVKKAGKGLASFDELNTLPAGSGTGGAVGGTAAEVVTATEETGDAASRSVTKAEVDMINFFGKYRSEIERIKESWEGLKDSVGDIIDAISQQFEQVDLADSGFKMVTNFITGILDGAKLLIGVIGKLFVAMNVPAIIQSGFKYLSELFKMIGDAITAVTPGIMDFVDKALVPIAEWIGKRLRDALDFFSGQLQNVGDWFSDHEEQFTIILGFLGDIAAAIWNIIEPILDSSWEVGKALISTINGLILGLVGSIMDLVTWVIDLPNKFSAAWESIKAVWGTVSAWFTDNVITPLSASFEELKAGILNIWGGIWIGIKGFINSIIGAVEGFANAIVMAMNTVINALNRLQIDVPSWITKKFGIRSFGFDIDTIRSVSIPRLAQGAVIPPNREFAAILGDQKRGVNIETPLETMMEAFDASFERAFARMGGLGVQKADITLEIDGTALVRKTFDLQKEEQRRRGRSLIIG